MLTVTGAQIPPQLGATTPHFHHHNTSSHRESNSALQKGTFLKLAIKIYFYHIIDAIVAIQGRDLLFCIFCLKNSISNENT